MPPSPSGTTSREGPIFWPWRGSKASAEASGSARKLGLESSSAISACSCAARPGSSRAMRARRSARASPVSSRSSSSSGDSEDQRSGSTSVPPGRSALQRGEQEQSRLLPVAAHAALGALEQARDLGFGQTGEITHLDHLRELLVDGGEAIERDVETEHVLVQAQAAA